MAGRHRTKLLACLFLPERLGKLFFTLGSSLELCAEEHAAARAGHWSFYSNRSWLHCLNSLIIKISHRNAGNEGCTSQEVNLVNGKAAAQGPAVHTALMLQQQGCSVVSCNYYYWERFFQPSALPRRQAAVRRPRGGGGADGVEVGCTSPWLRTGIPLQSKHKA